MFKYLSLSRYALAFALSAPFFMAALNTMPSIFSSIDDVLPPGYSTAEFRSIMGSAAGQTIDNLSSRAGDVYMPSEFGRKIDAIFPGIDLGERIGFDGFDEAAEAGYIGRDELMALVES